MVCAIARINLDSYQGNRKNVLFSLPSVVICLGCGRWIDNELLGVGCAVVLAGILWMLLQIIIRSLVGERIKNLFFKI